MPKIRQQINLLDKSYSATNTAISCSEISPLYGPQYYNGSVTYYLEVVGTATTGTAGNIYLKTQGASTLASFATSNLYQASGANVLYRVAFSSSPAGTTAVVVVSADAGGTGKTVTIISASVILVQDTGVYPLLQTVTMIEIGSNSPIQQTSFPTGASDITAPKYWGYNSTKWDGVLQATFYAVGVGPSSKTPSKAELQQSDGTGDNFATWAAVGGGASASDVTFQTGITLQNSTAAFTLTNGRNYRIVGLSSTTKTGATLYNAGILIIQTASSVQSYTTVANAVAVIRGGTGGAGETNQAACQSITAGSDLSISGIILYIIVTGSPADSLTVTIRTGSSTGSVVATSGAVLWPSGATGGALALPFASPVSLANGTTYYFVIERSGAYDASNFYSVYGTTAGGYAGGMAQRTNNAWGAETANSDMYYQLCAANGITKLEPQYMLAPYTLAAGANLQGLLAKWDSTEWSGVTNTYSGQACAANGSTSDVQIRTADDATLVATITDPDNCGSGAATMPADQNLDCKATTNNNDIYAVRIIVAVVVNTVTSAIKTVEDLARTSVKTVCDLVIASIKTIGDLA